MARQRIAIVGGGASGTALAWCLSRTPRSREALDVTLLHDEPVIGGHSHTIPVEVEGRKVGIDIGVQYVTPTVYPNLFALLDLPEIAARCGVEAVRPLHFASAFTEDINWANFRERDADPRFARMATAEVRAHGREFIEDVRRCWYGRVQGARGFSLRLKDYFALKPHLRQGDFVRFALFPILSVFNGYTAHDLLEGRLGDLWPMCARFPFLDGPLLSFDAPGQGWYRFRGGAQRWVEAMAGLAQERGVRVCLGHDVRRVTPKRGAGTAQVEWVHDGVAGGEDFDTVVLTTDMHADEALLNHADNPLWERQEPFVGRRHFPTLPGVCLIHTDSSILSPHTRDLQVEDIQFTGSSAWRPDADNPYGLPYDLRSTCATHIVHHTQPEAPHALYVSMYAEAEDTRWPTADRVVHRKEWRHGRWLSSYFADAKARLHKVQGLGGVWFAGNPATFDAEEGALLSAFGIAERIAPDFRYPFGGLDALRRPHARLLHLHFVRNIMFPDGWQVEAT